MIEVRLDLLRNGRLSRIVANNDGCHIGDDVDTLTVVNKDIPIQPSSPNDTK